MDELVSRLSESLGYPVRLERVHQYVPHLRKNVVVSYRLHFKSNEYQFTMKINSANEVKRIVSGMLDLLNQGLLLRPDGSCPRCGYHSTIHLARND